VRGKPRAVNYCDKAWKWLLKWSRERPDPAEQESRAVQRRRGDLHCPTMFPVRIETERLILREFLPADLDAIHAYATDREVVRFMIWGPNASLEETAANLAARWAHALDKPRLDYELAIELKEERVLIGAGGLRIKSERNRTADMGYVLGQKHWGKGYVTEAMQAMLELGFGKLGLHRIWSTTDTRNARSQRVLEKLGMRREALFKHDELRQGEWTDSHLYAILEEEWRARL
jgi:RimJ/RimL family protein N-acetyltransferase